MCRFAFVEPGDLFHDAMDRPLAMSASARRKESFIVAKHKGEFFKKCPGSEGQVCCNYFVINFASNCPMDCSYCYLQEYLADNSELKVFSNVGDLIDRGRSYAEQTSRHVFSRRHRRNHR